jgi:UDP:flavonoid glycosyltransferase YjiC (YdhE family)
VSRFLFVVPPLAAHANPAAAVSRALTGRGHEVAWVGSERYFRPLLGAEATVFGTGLRPYRGQRDRGMGAVRSLWDDFVVPFCAHIAPQVNGAAETYRPHVMVADQHAIAGSLVAQRRGLRWASLAPTQMEQARPFRNVQQVEQWIEGRVAAAGEALLGAAPEHDPRFSPHLVIDFTTPALTGRHDAPAHLAAVGPALDPRPGVPDFPWAALDRDRRLVLVTIGTVATDLGRDFFARVVQALEPLSGRVQAVINAPAALVPDPPSHVLVAPRTPVPELLPRVDAMICHGGMSTSCEALLNGIPLIVAPIRYDHPIVARQVAAVGAGLHRHFDRTSAAQFTASLEALLDDPEYRASAERIAASFTAAGGAETAAERLERLAA